jgi:hypothetical protein
MELSLISDLTGRKPDCGKRSEVEQCGEALGVQLIGLVDVPHHNLGLGCMSQ